MKTGVLVMAFYLEGKEVLLSRSKFTQSWMRHKAQRFEVQHEATSCLESQIRSSEWTPKRKR